MTRLLRVIAGLGLLSVVLAACGVGEGAGTAAGQQYVSGPGVLTTIPAADRKPLPRLHGELSDGGRLDSVAYAGKVVVFNVWGSWCPPCRAEAPVLRQVWEETKDKGVQFVGINIRDQRPAALAFERRFGITYPSVFDPDSVLFLGFRGTLPPDAIPSTIVVDRRGRVAARIVGAATYPDAEWSGG